MKCLKIILTIMLSFIVIACDKKENLKKQYIEACAEGNFDKARAAVEKLEAVDSWTAQEGMEYVNDKEIYYLLANPSNDNNARILYLYNTNERTQLPDMSDVVEVAISSGNPKLAEKLIKSGVSPSDFAPIVAAVNADEQDIVKILLYRQPESIMNDEVAEYVDYTFGKDFMNEIFAKGIDNIHHYNTRQQGQFAKQALKKGMKDIVDKLLQLDFKIFSSNTELLEYVNNYPNYSEIVAKQLRNSIIDKRKNAPLVHSQGVVEYYEGRYYAEGGYTDEDKAKMKMKFENDLIKYYNRDLLEIYGEALKVNRRDIALEAINAMKPTIEVYYGTSGDNKIKGIKVDGNHSLIYYNYDEINKLKADLKKSK